MNWNQLLVWAEVAASIVYFGILILTIIKKHRDFDLVGVLGASSVGAMIPAGLALIACGISPGLFQLLNDSIVRFAVIISGAGLVVLSILVFRSYSRGEKFLILKSCDADGQNILSFEVIHAVYGVNGSFLDVTQRLRQQIVSNKLSAIVSNDLAGGDPKPDVRKFLRIVYRYSGRVRTDEYWEDASISLPPQTSTNSPRR